MNDQHSNTNDAMDSMHENLAMLVQMGMLFVLPGVTIDDNRFVNREQMTVELANEGYATGDMAALRAGYRLCSYIELQHAIKRHNEEAESLMAGRLN